MLVFGTYGKLLSQENDGPVSECSRHEKQQGKANAFSSKVKIGLPNSKHNGIVFQRYVCTGSLPPGQVQILAR